MYKSGYFTKVVISGHKAPGFSSVNGITDHCIDLLSTGPSDREHCLLRLKVQTNRPVLVHTIPDLKTKVQDLIYNYRENDTFFGYDNKRVQ